MGRKKIDIVPITHNPTRRATFEKRRIGVLKKAMELSILCKSTISVTIYSPEGEVYIYSSEPYEDVIQKFKNYRGPYTLLTNEHVDDIVPGKSKSNHIGHQVMKQQTLPETKSVMPVIDGGFTTESNSTGSSVPAFNVAFPEFSHSASPRFHPQQVPSFAHDPHYGSSRAFMPFIHPSQVAAPAPVHAAPSMPNFVISKKSTSPAQEVEHQQVKNETTNVKDEKVGESEEKNDEVQHSGKRRSYSEMMEQHQDAPIQHLSVASLDVEHDLLTGDYEQELDSFFL